MYGGHDYKNLYGNEGVSSMTIWNILSLLTIGGTFPITDTYVLDELKAPYEIVKEIPGHPDLKGWYSFDTEVIYLDKDLQKDRTSFRYIIAHELIHKFRRENGLWTGPDENNEFEEAVATLGAKQVSEALHMERIRLCNRELYEHMAKDKALLEAIRETLEVIDDR